MFISMWKKLCNSLGIGVMPVRRRVDKARGNWGIETERMESRALLSASGLGRGRARDLVSAEVSTVEPRAKFTPPNVAGHWTVSGDIDGTADVVQNGTKLTATVNAMGLTIQTKGRFTNRSQNEISGTTRIANPITGKGKLAVKSHINFDSPGHFVADVHIVKLGVDLTNIVGIRST